MLLILYKTINLTDLLQNLRKKLKKIHKKNPKALKTLGF